MGKINSETTDAGEHVEKCEPSCTAVGMHAGASTLENSVEFPQKIKNRTTLQPSNRTTRNLFKGYRSAALGHMYPNVYGNAFNNSPIMERA